MKKLILFFFGIFLWLCFFDIVLADEIEEGIYVISSGLSEEKVIDIYYGITDNGTTTYNNLLIPNCKWRGTKDSNNVAELVILERTGV